MLSARQSRKAKSLALKLGDNLLRVAHHFAGGIPSTESLATSVCYYFYRPAFHFAQALTGSKCIHESGDSQLGPSHRSGMVLGAVWGCDRTARTRLAPYPRQENDADLGPNRIRENAGGISHLH